MTVTIDATPEEIAALVLAVQERRDVGEEAASKPGIVHGEAT